MTDRTPYAADDAPSAEDAPSSLFFPSEDPERRAARLAKARELEALIKAGIERFNALSPEQQEAERKAQRESWVRGEMSWPKPRFKYVGGVKVYESHSDYCNG